MGRSTILSLLVVLAGCASAPSGPRTFADAQVLFDLQPDTPEVATYRNDWYGFNNAQHLDERDGCYPKAEGSLVQIMEIDAKGTITGYFADRDDGRSQCWRRTYLGVAFPKPPFAPFYIRLEMH